MSPNVSVEWNFLTRSWSSIGPLVGVAVGAWLSRSWQRKQWVRDSKAAEYRELISSLSQCAHALMDKFNSNFPGGTFTSGADLIELDGAESRAYNTISDRLFIADVMKREKVRERWLTVIRQTEGTKFWAEWSALYKTMVSTARHDLNLTEEIEMTKRTFRRGLTRLWIVVAVGFDLWVLAEFLLHGPHGDGDAPYALAVVAAVNVGWFAALRACFWVMDGFFKED